MTTPELGTVLIEAGGLLTAMLLARRFALRHVPACYLSQRVRTRECRRDGVCRLATTPAVAATLVGLVLILIT